MILIYFLSKPHNIAIGIIKKIYIPMIVGQISIGFLISIVDAIKKEKEESSCYAVEVSFRYCE